MGLLTWSLCWETEAEVDPLESISDFVTSPGRCFLFLLFSCSILSVKNIFFFISISTLQVLKVPDYNAAPYKCLPEEGGGAIFHFIPEIWQGKSRSWSWWMLDYSHQLFGEQYKYLGT